VFLFSRLRLLRILLLRAPSFPLLIGGVRGFGGGRWLLGIGLFGTSLLPLLGLSVSLSTTSVGRVLLGSLRGHGWVVPGFGGSWRWLPGRVVGLGGLPLLRLLGRELNCSAWTSTSLLLSGLPRRLGVVRFSWTLPTVPPLGGLLITSLASMGCLTL
jgi:hypothetical protein